MYGLSVWKANSSELNLFSPFFWLHGGVNAVLGSFLYWDDSSKDSPLFAIKLTNKRLLALVRTSSQQQQSQTPITPLCYCCKSTRTKGRITIAQAGTIIYIKHQPTEQWIRHRCGKNKLDSFTCSLCLFCILYSLLLEMYSLFLTWRTKCQNMSRDKNISKRGTRISGVSLGWNKSNIKPPVSSKN